MAEGSYGATGASAKVSKSEGLIGMGFFIAVIALIIFAVYWIWKKTDLIARATSVWQAGQDTATEAVVTGAQYRITDPTQARTVAGDYYPVKTLTQEDYDRMLKETGILEPLIRTGNMIVPETVLNYAGRVGEQGAYTVNKLGLNNSYVDLPPLQKGLVTFGEGLGNFFGVDLIQAGYNMRSDVQKSAGVT